MGNIITRLQTAIAPLFSAFKTPCRILMLGLDNAGKTTVLYQLKLGEHGNHVPTIGFNVETIEFKNVSFTVWDVGGQDRIRGLWHHYFQGTDGLIFVLDSVDRDRIDEARDVLHDLANQMELESAAICVLANKQDVQGAMNIAEITSRLELAKMRRNWYVQATCAVNGEGLYEGLDWMAKALTQAKSK